MKAIWQGTVIAESDDTVVVENNHYFPRAALNMVHFSASQRTSHCPWKGEAHYFDVVVGEQRNPDAAWFYPEPKAAASEIKERVAFWRGVQVVE